MIDIPKITVNVLLATAFFTLFITIFFFTYAKYIEKQIAIKNLTYLVKDMTSNLILLPPEYKQYLSSLVNDVDISINKQADIDVYQSVIPECNIAELEAIYLLLDKTIYIRKKGILDSRQFSLLDCSNISNCQKKMQEINKMQIGTTEKQELKAQYENAYLHKALDFLKYYFDLLSSKEYDEAWEFLKGNRGKYQGRQRLNTFFKNTRSIIGHLEIFVSLYEIFHMARERLSLKCQST
jgi:hypothetical protein